MTLDEKIEETEKAIERLEKSAEQDHSERMFVAIAEAVREERQTLEWLKDYKRLLEALENQNTLREELMKFRGGITDENILIGFNMAIAICNVYLGKGE